MGMEKLSMGACAQAQGLALAPIASTHAHTYEPPGETLTT